MPNSNIGSAGYLIEEDRACRALASAVILQAIDDYQTTRKPKDGDGMRNIEINRRSARVFLMSDSDRIYGFVWMCNQIGFDHKRIRSRIESPGLMAEMRRAVKRQIIGSRLKDAPET